MFSLLHQYLINHSSVSLPSIGTFQFAETAALPSIDGYVAPPKLEIILVDDFANEANPQLIGFLAKQLDVTETQVQTLFQQFLQSIKNTLAEKQTLQWENVGEFKKDDTGKIHFAQTKDLDIYYQPIEANRVNHHNNTDKFDVLVGDNETTNIAIQEEWNDAEDKKNHWWWIWAIIIGAIALIVIAVKYVY